MRTLRGLTTGGQPKLRWVDTRCANINEIQVVSCLWYGDTEVTKKCSHRKMDRFTGDLRGKVEEWLRWDKVMIIIIISY